jgi:hypothetical protein
VFVLLSLWRPGGGLEVKSVCFTVIMATRGGARGEKCLFYCRKGDRRGGQRGSQYFSIISVYFLVYVFCYGPISFLIFFVGCVRVHIEGGKSLQNLHIFQMTSSGGAARGEKCLFYCHYGDQGGG